MGVLNNAHAMWKELVSDSEKKGKNRRSLIRTRNNRPRSETEMLSLGQFISERGCKGIL